MNTLLLVVLSLAALPGSCLAAPPDLLYVLQPDAVPIAALAQSEADWVVLEPTTDGGLAGDFTPAELATIKAGGACPKTVLAYLSIGEAEDYRPYWDGSWVDGAGVPVPGVAPAWLGPLNPDFAGNYKVRYWDAGWQALMLGTPGVTPLDRIVEQGFDGVYLDIVDAYYYWSAENPELTRADARLRMIEFIETIAAYARITRGASGFLVFPQNAAEIIRDDNDGFDALTARYFAAISGIGKEDLFYDELMPQPASETNYALDQLLEFVARNKPVLLTDYVIDQGNPGAASNDARAADFITRARAEGFIPYAAHQDRALDEIVTFSGESWTFDQPGAGCAAACATDLNTDGSTNAGDIAILLASWGTASSDLNSDSTTDAGDLAVLLAAWGACTLAN